jgi:CBS domain-containing protein
MKVMRIAQVPAPSISVTATVQEAIPNMPSEQGCAVAIVDGKHLEGTLSKDDLILRVVAQGRDPSTTTVREVMTPPLTTVSPDSEAEDALKLMFEKHQCYLPIVDSRGDLKGWLGICQLFKENLDDLVGQLASLEAYIAADGPGGD